MLQLVVGLPPAELISTLRLHLLKDGAAHSLPQLASSRYQSSQACVIVSVMVNAAVLVLAGRRTRNAVRRCSGCSWRCSTGVCMIR